MLIFDLLIHPLLKSKQSLKIKPDISMKLDKKNGYKTIRRIGIFLALIVNFFSSIAQNENRTVKLNVNGKLIWSDNQKEARFWGVNYTVPFAHAFRQIQREGEDHKKAIDEDVYHFARLGLNAFRIHVWDCEISDQEGNLLDNEHLDLLDYLIHKLQERGIYTFITPIAYWGNGYPENDEEGLAGFSANFHKGNVYTEPEAIEAQQNYLSQFVSHVNPYSGKAYKDDPMVVGFEVCNEPGHSKVKETKAFVKKMVQTIKATGCTKPVYYNITQNISLLESYIKGGTDGVTFQWYPTGLVSGRMQQGNLLPHVDVYPLPFEANPVFKNQGRLVYEFDPADVNQTYLYPATALSFKEAGMQWVTMFSYDPMAIASSNTEYQTHFLNLAYTPQKALGFLIAGELFRNPEFQRNRLKEKKPFEIPGLNLNPEEDLAELFTNHKFYYTNTTNSTVLNPGLLESIAGYGNSQVVKYNGYGAYFMDKLKDGLWRLEVMPDAIQVRDPFKQASPNVKNVVIKWNTNRMQLALQDLGRQFFIQGIDKDNDMGDMAEQAQFEIRPGVYLLSKQKLAINEIEKLKKQLSMMEFIAPKENVDKNYIVHNPAEFIYEKEEYQLKLTYVAPDMCGKKLFLQIVNPVYWKADNRVIEIPMMKKDHYTYELSVPDSLIHLGWLNYGIAVKGGDGEEQIFPANIRGPIKRWDFYTDTWYQQKVISPCSPIQLFNAGTEKNFNLFKANRNLQVKFIPSAAVGEAKMRVTSDVGKGGSTQLDNALFAYEKFIGDLIAPLGKSVKNYSELLIEGNGLSDSVNMNVLLVTKHGQAYQTKFSLHPSKKVYSVNLNSFVSGKMMLLPKSYPGFMADWYEAKRHDEFKLEDVEKLQLIIHQDRNTKPIDFEIQSIYIQ